MLLGNYFSLHVSDFIVSCCLGLITDKSQLIRESKGDEYWAKLRTTSKIFEHVIFQNLVKPYDYCRKLKKWSAPYLII